MFLVLRESLIHGYITPQQSLDDLFAPPESLPAFGSQPDREGKLPLGFWSSPWFATAFLILPLILHLVLSQGARSRSAVRLP